MNRLEEVLKLAATEPAHRPEFFQLLLESDVFVPGESTTQQLDASTPEGKEILGLQRATRFIPTKAENYQGIEQAARSAGLLK